MFGFMGSPCRNCVSGEVHNTYRGFFCGLSGALREDYSPAARFLVNRDSTFLSLLTAAVSPQDPVAVPSTCCNPISIPKPLYQHGLHARYAAAVTICGLSTKLEDDHSDEKGLRKTLAKLMGHTISPMTDRATAFLNTVRFPTAEVVDVLREQDVIERQKSDLVKAASPTAAAYGAIFGHAAHIAEAPQQSASLTSLGSKLGQLIYWKDAHDDLTADTLRGRFNPLQHSEPGEFEHHFSKTITEFHSIAQTTSLGKLQKLSQQIISNTFFRHQSLLPKDTLADLSPPSLSPGGGDPKKYTVTKKKKSCCDQCSDWCSTPNCIPCCDCGNGDSGCLDCGDCCSCN